MICNNCGSSVDSINRFCPKCGAPLQDQSPPTQSSGAPYTAPYTAPQYTAPQSGMPPMGGPTAPPPKKSSGCGKIILIVAIILVILGIGLAAAIYYGYRYTERTLKSSEAYTVALNALKDSPEVKEELGDIEETGFPIGAYSQDAGGSGKAAFVMSVKGSKGSGQYQVELTRSNSVWHLDTGIVRTAGGATIRVADTRGTPGELPGDNSNTSLVPRDPGSKNIISGGVLNSKALSLPKPNYPAIAKQAHATGTVVVQVLVDENGNVLTARAVSGHPLLQASAVAAARGAKFAPTKLSGKPVKVQGTLSYNFTLE